jgi:hypothetical protein
MCPGVESNHGHRDFQSPMPPEFFLLCVKDGSLETGRRGVGGLSIYPPGRVNWPAAPKQAKQILVARALLCRLC